MKVRFIADSNGEIEGLYKGYNVSLDETYEVIGFGAKVFIKVNNRILDVFPSRLEVVDEK